MSHTPHVSPVPEVTLAELSKKIEKGFERMDKGFEVAGKNFDEVHKALIRLDHKIDYSIEELAGMAARQFLAVRADIADLRVTGSVSSGGNGLDWTKL